MKMIHVAPAPGMRIINPFQGNTELKADVMPDDPFWRRRAAEGGVIITPVDGKPKAKPAARPVAAAPTAIDVPNKK